MTRIFVYGTLRQGFHNNVLLEGSKCLGLAVTKEKYAMFGGNIPYVNKAYSEYNIVGEVYLVDDNCLNALDHLEGHPDWYKRETIEVTLEETNETINADIYFNTNNKNMFPTGDYAEGLKIRENKEQASYT